MREYKAPETIPNLFDSDKVNLFLGGSIEMGNAPRWQDQIVKALEEFPINIFNPRRDDWDSSWIQDPTPGTQFHKQVTWELNAQNSSDILLYYFAGNTMSPITLLELGLHADSDMNINDHILVYVDDKYTRRGNVIITCEYSGISWTNDKEEFLNRIKDKVVRYAKNLRWQV